MNNNAKYWTYSWVKEKEETRLLQPMLGLSYKQYGGMAYYLDLCMQWGPANKSAKYWFSL